MAKSCTLGSGILYNDILERVNKNRPVANFIYASYLMPGVAANMDSKGFNRNNDDEHSVDDVFKFLNINDYLSELNDDNTMLSRAYHIMDSYSEYINFPDFETPYKIAMEINQKHPGKVAYIIQNGANFNVVIDDKNASTQIHSGEMVEYMKLWQVLKEEFEKSGVHLADILKKIPAVVNPQFSSKVASDLYVLSLKDNKILTKEDIKTLLTFNEDSYLYSQAVNRGWGNTDEIANKIYDYLKSKDKIPEGIKSFINALLEDCKKFKGLPLKSIQSKIDKLSLDTKYSTEEFKKQSIIDKIVRNFNAGAKEVIVKSSEMQKLSDAAIESVYVIERQLRVLNARKGSPETIKELKKLKRRLLDDIHNKRYYGSLTRFLAQPARYIEGIKARINALDPLNTKGLEGASKIAEVVDKFFAFYNSYYTIVETLSNTQNLNLDEFLKEEDITFLEKTASEIKEQLDKIKKSIISLRKQGMKEILTATLPNADPLEIAHLLSIGDSDPNFIEKVYAVGRSSNAFINSTGTIITKANNERDKKMNIIKTKINRLDNKLKEAGHDSSFIYTINMDSKKPKYEIISNYDWRAYYTARARYIYTLKDEGLKGVELESAIEDWEEANTVEVVVDSSNGRTERMPRIDYINRELTKAWDTWDTAQREYYTQMLKLKGELDSLLPISSQSLYRPPQIRKTSLEVREDWKKGKISFDQAIKLILDKLKFWKRRSDDTRFSPAPTEGESLYDTVPTEEEELPTGKSNYDNTLVNFVPVYYTGYLKEQSDLSMDFSGALQDYAAMALNYEAMSSIEKTLLMIRDYVKDLGVPESKQSNKLVDKVMNSEIELFKYIKKSSPTTESMIDGALSMLVYNNALKNNFNTRFWLGLIKYGNWKNLSLNVLGATSNFLNGEYQMIIEAVGGEYYNFEDYSFAHGVLFKYNSVDSPGKIVELINNNIESKEHLLGMLFDPMEENYSEMAHERYYTFKSTRLLDKLDSGALYHYGEYLIHYTNMLAMLHSEKVIYKGKEISLYDAFETTDGIDGVKDLNLKEGVRLLDGSEVTDQYIDDLKMRIKFVNEQCHGAMNKEQYGTIQSKLYGKAAMNYRQWMVESYSRRYRKEHFDTMAASVSMSNFLKNNYVIKDGKKTSLKDALTREYKDGSNTDFKLVVPKGLTTLSGKPVTEAYLETLLDKERKKAGIVTGYKRSAFRTIKGLLTSHFNTANKLGIKYEDLDTRQKADLNRAIGEFASLMIINISAAVAGSYKDHDDDNWMGIFWLYMLKRMRMDISAFTLPGVVDSARYIINSPIPAVNTLKQLGYILKFGDLFKTVKGENKYWRNIKKFVIPFYNQIDMLINMKEDDRLFKMFMQ